MEDDLCILLFVLINWLIVYVILEFHIINNKRRDVRKMFIELDAMFEKRLILLDKMIDIVKSYDKNQFDDFGSNLYDYLKNYNTFECNKKLEINALIEGNIKKILLVRKVYPELDNVEKYVKLEKQLVRINKIINKLCIRYNKFLKNYMDRKIIFPSGIICFLFRFYSYNYFEFNE